MGVEIFKVGSGDVSWLEMLKYIAKKNKPVLMATGASTLAEVDEAVKTIREQGNSQIILLQCVTNYPSEFESANVRVIEAYQKAFDVLVGYSDHTPGYIVPMATVALGGCVIEKHFTDDKTRAGPDHPHALDPKEFRLMVQNIRLLEKSLGSPVKTIYPEENETVVLQRRCVRAKIDILAGTKITKEMLDILRPAPAGALLPKEFRSAIGHLAQREIKKGEAIRWDLI